MQNHLHNRSEMSIFIYAIILVQHDQFDSSLLLETTDRISSSGVIYLVEWNSVSAVVSNIKTDSLTPDDSTVMEYANVIEKLAKNYDVIPVRFGTLFKTIGSIKYMLKKNYTTIRQNLHIIKNKCEFGLKVFYDSKKLKDSFMLKPVIGQEEDKANFPNAKKSVYLDYINKKMVIHRCEELCLSFTNSIIFDIKECFARLNPVSRFEKMVTDSNLISAVFLVEKNKENELIYAVKSLKKRHSNLNFVLTGPWPPYNFVKLTNQL